MTGEPSYHAQVWEGVPTLGVSLCITFSVSNKHIFLAKLYNFVIHGSKVVLAAITNNIVGSSQTVSIHET